MSEVPRQILAKIQDSTKTVPCPFDEEFLRLVRYLCSCGHVQPLCRLYFCRYCSDLRCGQCVSHEVDSHYCPNCLENMPSAEARLKKNRCANCFDCPSCGHTLSTRATSMTVVPSPQVEGSDNQSSKAETNKGYFLACNSCRWSTRDINLPDRITPSEKWLEPENSGVTRFDSLIHHYQSIANDEKLKRENKIFLGRKLSYLQLAEKFGLRKVGISPHLKKNNSLDNSSLDKTRGRDIAFVPSKAKCIEQIEVIDYEEVFSNQINLCNITSLEQRFLQLDTQPVLMTSVFPRPKNLAVKKSTRCRKCEHILTKHDYKCDSIKFQLKLSAFYHVPEIVIPSQINHVLRASQEFNFILKVTNPGHHSTYIEFLDLDTYIKQREISRNTFVTKLGDGFDQKILNDFKKTESTLSTKSSSKESPTFPLKSGQLAAKFKTFANAKFLSLTNEPNTAGETRVKTYLPARDDAAEFDDHDRDFPTGIVDDSRIVAWRKSNKVGIKAKVKVNCDLKRGTEVITGFALRFLYTNTVPSLEQREIQTSEITIPVFVVLGTCDS